MSRGQELGHAVNIATTSHRLRVCKLRVILNPMPHNKPHWHPIALTSSIPDLSRIRGAIHERGCC